MGGLVLDVVQSWALLLQAQSSKINSVGGNRSWFPMNNEYPAPESELILVLGRTCKRLVICHVYWGLVIFWLTRHWKKMTSIREFTLDVATHATGHPKVVLRGKGKMGEKKWQLSETQVESPQECQPLAGCPLSCIFFQPSVFPKESFSMTSAYHCFPGASEDAGIKRRKASRFPLQVAFQWWDNALPKSACSLLLGHGQKQPPHSFWRWQQCTCVSFPDRCGNCRIDIHSLKKKTHPKPDLENQHPPPSKTPPSRLLNFYVKCLCASCSLLPRLCPPLRWLSPTLSVLVPMGGDGSRHSGGSGMSHIPRGWCPPPALSISLGISRETFLVRQQIFNLKKALNYQNRSRQGCVSLTHHADRRIRVILHPRLPWGSLLLDLLQMCTQLGANLPHRDTIFGLLKWRGSCI